MYPIFRVFQNVSFISLAGLIMTGCMVNMPVYRAFSNGSGYQEAKLENNRYSVSYTGEHFLNAETTTRYFLFRAAQLTQTAGYDYFIVYDKLVRQRSRFRSDPYSNGRYGYFNSWGYAHYHYDYYTYCCDNVWYEVSADIVMHKGKKPVDNQNAYYAQQLTDFLNDEVQHSDSVTQPVMSD